MTLYWKIVADFSTTLNLKVAVWATTATLDSATDDDGVALPTWTYFFTVDESSSSKEYIKCTLTSTALTNIQNITRQGVLSAWFARSHRKWAVVKITDFACLQKIAETLDWLVFADTTARDAYLWWDWVATLPHPNVFVTDTWLFYNYNLVTAQWESIDTGTTTPNATETAAGKVELATDAEITAWTATGWTWATIVPTSAQTIKSISLKATEVTLAEADHIPYNDNGTDKKMLVSVFRDQLASSATAKGTVELATDAEASTWTDETRYINPKQLYDNLKIYRSQGSYNNNATITLTHWLGRVPRFIRMTLYCFKSQFPFTSQWTYNWTAYQSMNFYNESTSDDGVRWIEQSTSYLTKSWITDNNSGTSDVSTVTVTTYDSTEVVLNVACTWGSGTQLHYTAYYQIEII
jgi:hypothetical protein